ncbi:MAG: sensor histidine kinase [Solirubrobacteraceae bacterium]
MASAPDHIPGGSHGRGSRRRGSKRRLAPIAPAALEVVLAVGAATAVVALMQSAAPPAGLGVLYLLAVLEVAVRRGELAALTTAVLGVLTLNYFFITPRQRLSIAHTQDLVELGVFLIAALVVGRLAQRERLRAAEADTRAGLAAAREQEAKLLAEAASTILSGPSLEAQLTSVEALVAAATGASVVRLVTEMTAAPGPDELAVGLKALHPTWLYLSRDVAWEQHQLDRLAEPLGKLIDVARARERGAEQEAEIEAGRRAETARTAVLHAISHDLRSPLTAITTAVSALRTGRVSELEGTELLDVINGESIRLAKLVDDLLDLSMIEAGAVRPRSDWCDLHDVVVSAAAQLGPSHPLEFALEADLPLVRADPAQLERVFSNLLQNAVKFSPVGGLVRVSGGASGGRVTVRVTDQGQGIPLDQRTRVFEPFFRGRSGSRAGSGLGLAICRGFVEANGGRIALQVDSGQGTSFAVSFPVVEQPETVGPAL